MLGCEERGISERERRGKGKKLAVKLEGREQEKGRKGDFKGEEEEKREKEGREGERASVSCLESSWRRNKRQKKKRRRRRRRKCRPA